MEPIKKMGIGVGVMILKDGKILLGQRRFDSIKFGDKLYGDRVWTMPGGKLDFGESFEDCAKREVLVDTGVIINTKDLEVISLTNDITPEAHFVTIGMLLREYPNESRFMEPNDITEWKWFPLDELPSPLFPPSQKILSNFKDGKFYKN